LDKIEVRDDGHGIEASQLGLAVAGSYTSRLKDTNHLSKFAVNPIAVIKFRFSKWLLIDVNSLSACGEEYGFRGEALSSICSFGTVSITTKSEAEPHAFKYILADSGRVTGQTRTGNGRGTVVTVQDLFAKFPVRRNFIREKPRTVSELQEIENYLKSIGLANPPVRKPRRKLHLHRSNLINFKL